MSTPSSAPSGANSAAGQRNRVLTKEVLQLSASLLALLSLLMFGLSYFAASEYFHALGLTPEQAGIDKQTLLTRVGAIASVLIAFCLPIMYSLALLAKRLILRTPLRVLHEYPLAKSLAFGSALGVVVCAPGWHPLDHPREVLVIGAAFGVAVYSPIAHHLVLKGFSTTSLCLAGLAVGCLAAAPALGDQAHQDALDLREHGRITSLASNIGVRATLANATWTDLGDAHRRGMIIYLGEQNGMAAFLPCGEHAVQRVPTAQLRLSLLGTDWGSHVVCTGALG
ncbi:hypothetical protein [Kitasatospora kifunensis]|uniref:Drug/metabolite transporter (DMT)-like permease n=1 Tax=Kitasatospora kifunensis TaxID=58351 RepID=A0A7W7QWH5_KITKI|nr:hypothetical protein [Kitasatospora kifunensis]MBB4921063.1 drug/metabolite transporter (DMT)-like permease [Kitasatospora kifunensis]